MNYEFKMNDREADAAKKWTSEHKCSTRFWPKSVTPSPRFTYSFTSTGIGDSVIVSCHCGAKKDVTDYSSW